MEKLRGHGLRDDAIGVIQVGDVVAEILVNGWWIITVEDCMTNLHGHGYYLELSQNGRKLDMNQTGFLTVDDVIDGMFVSTWHEAMLFLGWSIKYFKDRTPSSQEEEKCGWCDSTTYPHICEGSLTTLMRWVKEGADLVSTANASAPKPPKVTQGEQDRADMSAAWSRCNCEIAQTDWRQHAPSCEYYKEGKRIHLRNRRFSEHPRRIRS